MYKLLHSNISRLYHTKVPATGVGLLRLLFGLVTLQEVFFLLYFNHLIFDPIPYLDIEFPMISFFLCLWALIAASLVVGYRCQQAIIANYLFWIVFVNFTPMQRDFDGGFDLFMIGANLLMIFMPIGKAFSVDNLRIKFQQPFKHYSSYTPQQVSSLAYSLPVIICLGFLYFDSAIHKMFAEHWRNGLGAWLPASIPYYISAINMTWLLDSEILQKTMGYLILVFQFSFLFLFHFRYLRPLYFVLGAGLHIGITLTLNIYPFGIGMLIFYSLILPFSWYQKIGNYLIAKTPRLTVFYDEQCPLCAKTILTINHFDIFKCIDFKGAQTYASKYSEINKISRTTLLTDLYALDDNHVVYSGVETYAKILINMRYLAFVGYCLNVPFIYHFACKKYRAIADSRTRISCDSHCEPVKIETVTQFSLYDQIFHPTSEKSARRNIHRISKILILISLLQINSSVYYGLIYRLDIDTKSNVVTALLTKVSNSFVHYSSAFIGITPHALYLHDHFEGYDHLLAITYLDDSGKEKWLPFVTEEGRMASPNWGRVHSMWANIAVSPTIDHWRLSKFIMKTTAFWGIEEGLDLNSTTFTIKLKKISAPFHWVEGLLTSNLSGKWTTIGNATWDDKAINISLPDDINAL